MGWGGGGWEGRGGSGEEKMQRRLYLSPEGSPWGFG